MKLSDIARRIIEASQDDEDYVHIGYGKYKDKDHVDDPSAPTFKKDDSGAFVPAKGGDDEKGDDKGGEEEPKPSGKGLGAGDFERDFDDSEPEDKPFGGDTGKDADFGGEGDDYEISDANSGPIDRDDILDMLKKDPEIAKALGDNPYWDGEDLVPDDDEGETAGTVSGNMTLGDLKKQILNKDESITVNGKKYRPIKEVKQHILKENYQRYFGDKK